MAVEENETSTMSAGNSSSSTNKQQQQQPQEMLTSSESNQSPSSIAGGGGASSSASGQLENVKVAVRVRPFTEREKQRNSKRIVDIEQNTVAIYNPKSNGEHKKFTFDYSYWSHDGFKRNSDGINTPDESHLNSTKYIGQEKVFDDLGVFLLNNALEGYNSALLAYGQTGSGKSYTVSGYGQNEGILPRFARALFTELDRRTATAEREIDDSNKNELDHSTNTAGAADKNEETAAPAEAATVAAAEETTPPQQQQATPENKKNRYEVYFSMIEIYNEVVRDLLAQNHGYSAAQAANLTRRGLKVREHPKRGFFVEGLISYPCANKEEIEQRIEEGQLNKSIAATSMNETSSRGHTIYEFRIKQYRQQSSGGSKVKEAATTTTSGGGAAQTASVTKSSSTAETLTTSVVQLVDLAGSERLAVHVTGQLGGDSFIGSRSSSPFSRDDQHSVRNPTTAAATRRATTRMRAPPTSASSTGSSSTNAPASVGQQSFSMIKRNVQGSSSLYDNHQQRFKESVSINQSLSALGNCIQVMSQYSQQPQAQQQQSSQHKIPYRDSVLTKLLNRCCLSGNSKVVIIATLSPADANYDDTLSTLRFADRAKQIKTHAKINQMSRGEIVDVLQKENERLKQMIDGRVTRSDDSSQTSNFDDTENVADNFNGPKAGTTMSSTSGGGAPAQLESSTDPAQGGRGAAAGRAMAASRAAAGRPTRGARNQVESLAASNRRQLEQNKRLNATKLAASKSLRLTGSNPALNEQMKELVSPASKKMASKEAEQASQLAREIIGSSLSSIKKSKSMATGLASKGPTNGTDEQQQLVSRPSRDKLNRGKSFLINDDGSGGDELQQLQQQQLDELELVAAELLDEIDFTELGDIEVGGEELLSPDSDDSFAALAEEGLSNEEKIGLLNKLLSNSNVANRIRKQYELSTRGGKLGGGGGATKMARPRRTNQQRQQQGKDSDGSMSQRVTAISSSLKKTNPYLSNLNPDEQLTGMITYLIKQGETIVGKNNDCDILLYGPELRGRHSKITRLILADNETGQQPNGGADRQQQQAAPPTGTGAAKVSPSQIFIEPILEPKRPKRPTDTTAAPAAEKEEQEQQQQVNVALMVNGAPLTGKTQLHHCDRLLFGSNAYFVFIDQTEQSQSTSGATTIADQDLVTYDMAHSEVLRKVMSDAKNDRVIQEIKEYTHRPGTGKHKDKSASNHSQQHHLKDNEPRPPPLASAVGAEVAPPVPDPRLSHVKSSRLTRSMTIHGDQDGNEGATRVSSNMTQTDVIEERPDSQATQAEESAEVGGGRDSRSANNELEVNYREKLMEDTYEYAMPVAEVNTIAKEMRIKVSYGLKILTGEEQMPEVYGYNLDSTSGSDSLSSVSGSIGGGGGGGDNMIKDQQQQQQPQQQPRAQSSGNSTIATTATMNATATNYEESTSESPIVSRSIRPASLDIPPALFVHVHLEELNMDFYWSKEKFQARRFRILELYGAWDVGGKSGLVEYLIEQSKYQGEFMLDPFIDDPLTTQVLIGHAQVALKPLSHRSDMNEFYDVLDLDDEIVGSIRVQAIPCKLADKTTTTGPKRSHHSPHFEPLSEKELAESFIENPSDLLGKELIFLIRMMSCKDLPKRYCRICCQYTFNREKSIIRTNLIREFVDGNESETSEEQQQQERQADGDQKAADEQLEFNHEHYVQIDKVNQDILDFLEHGFLAIQLIGRYRLVQPAAAANVTAAPVATNDDEEEQRQQQQLQQLQQLQQQVANPTIITTIINSINKFKYKIEQQGGAFNGMNYSGSIYTNSITDSAKSDRRIASSGMINSSASSVASTSATVNLFDQQNDDDDAINSMNGLSQENIIDMILTKRKLDRAEVQLHYLKRTINIAEHYNKKHIPVKTVKKLLNSYGHEIESGSLEEMVADVNVKGKSAGNKNSGCIIQ